MARESTPAFREGFRVAMRAAGRDLVTPSDRIPRGFRPFDRTAVGHRTHHADVAWGWSRDDGGGKADGSRLLSYIPSVDLVDTVIGVVIGTLCTAGFEQIRIRSANARSGRAASLVLATQLSEAVAAIDFFIELVRPLPPGLSAGLRATWDETRQDLVGVVTDADFLRLTMAVSTVEELEAICRQEGPAPLTELLDHKREHVRVAAEIAWRAARPGDGWVPAPVADQSGAYTGLGRPSAVT